MAACRHHPQDPGTPFIVTPATATALSSVGSTLRHMRALKVQGPLSALSALLPSLVQCTALTQLQVDLDRGGGGGEQLNTPASQVAAMAAALQGAPAAQPAAGPAAQEHTLTLPPGLQLSACLSHISHLTLSGASSAAAEQLVTAVSSTVTHLSLQHPRVSYGIDDAMRACTGLQSVQLDVISAGELDALLSIPTLRRVSCTYWHAAGPVSSAPPVRCSWEVLRLGEGRHALQLARRPLNIPLGVRQLRLGGVRFSLQNVTEESEQSTAFLTHELASGLAAAGEQVLWDDDIMDICCSRSEPWFGKNEQPGIFAAFLRGLAPLAATAPATVSITATEAYGGKAPPLGAAEFAALGTVFQEQQQVRRIRLERPCSITADAWPVLLLPAAEAAPGVPQLPLMPHLETIELSIRQLESGSISALLECALHCQQRLQLVIRVRDAGAVHELRAVAAQLADAGSRVSLRVTCW